MPRNTTRPVSVVPGVMMALCLLLGMSGCIIPSWMFRSPPRTGQEFPNLSLTPMSEADAKQLGVDNAPFVLTDIAAEHMVVCVFDMYCRYCQKGAPQLNEIHAGLVQRGLGQNVPMLGISLANSPFEANIFRTKFKLSFPVLPDPDSAVREALGRVGTPSVFVLSKQNGALRIIKRQDGMFVEKKPAAFLKAALAKAGLASTR